MSVEEKAILNRCGHLGFRCFTGFDRRDKEKKKPILEGKALAEWQELLEKRFPQPVSGGTPFVLKIAQVVKDKKTQEGLDVTERNLSSAARAYHEENKEDHARTRGTVEKAAKAVLDAQVSMHATVEDIASSLGVGMDKKQRNTFVRATRARHVSS